VVGVAVPVVNPVKLELAHEALSTRSVGTFTSQDDWNSAVQQLHAANQLPVGGIRNGLIDDEDIRTRAHKEFECLTAASGSQDPASFPLEQAAHRQSRFISVIDHQDRMIVSELP
jgi:hypothetical protein